MPLTTFTRLPSHRGNALVLEAVLAAIQEHYPEVAPERIPMQVTEGCGVVWCGGGCGGLFD